MLTTILLTSGLALAQESTQRTEAAAPECSVQDFNDADGKLVVQVKYCPNGDAEQNNSGITGAQGYLDSFLVLTEEQELALRERAKRGFEEMDAEIKAYKALENPISVWQDIAATPALVEYFKDTFDTIGVSVEGSEQSFTVTHTGAALELSEGIADSVNFRVTITQQQVLNMVQNAADNSISEQESWRILSVLFTPMTAVTLDNEVFTNNWRRKRLGVEDHTHVHLLNPSGETATSHTLFFVKGQWVVVKGLHGKPKRTFKLTPAQALEYQKKTFSAMRANDKKQWKAWAKWYKQWRDGVSETH